MVRDSGGEEREEDPPPYQLIEVQGLSQLLIVQACLAQGGLHQENLVLEGNRGGGGGRGDRA